MTKEIEGEQKKTKSKKHSMSQDALAGAFAGFSSRMLTAPFDVIKIRNQLLVKHLEKTPSMLGAMRSIIKDEGVTALWKGNVPALLLWISYAFIQFGSYGKLKDMYESQVAKSQHVTGADSSGENTNQPKVLALLSRSGALFLIGAAAGKVFAIVFMSSYLIYCVGIIATVVTYPFDIMRTQFAVQETTRYFNGIPSYLRYTYQTYGLKGKK